MLVKVIVTDGKLDEKYIDIDLKRIKGVDVTKDGSIALRMEDGLVYAVEEAEGRQIIEALQQLE
jgi:predicted transcriptional regulator